ncbi:hypothetical protein QE152_g18140 [Popillia japonica]|uniref:Uncharacterized protein n=1 Tax=Popillia japonica TaxID=7064 RepID=A0AAW1L4D5_POPJA
MDNETIIKNSKDIRGREMEADITDRIAEEEAIFGRRESLKRTPPDLKRFRSFSAPSRKPPEKVDEGPRTPSGVDAEADKW